MELTQTEIAAFNQVQESVSKLRDEYATVCADILIAEKKLKELPLLPVPPEDLKAAIIDMVEASGYGYRIAIKRQIKALATNEKCGFSIGSKEFNLLGTPLRFSEINSALYGGSSPGVVGYQNMLTASNIGLVDTAIFSVAGELVKTLLTSVMEEMTADDLGYKGIKKDQIGTDRATRLATIKATNEYLELLRDRKSKLSISLFRLGILVSEE